MTFDTITVSETLVTFNKCHLDSCKNRATHQIRMYVSSTPWDGDSDLYEVCADHKDAAEEIFEQGCQDERDFNEDLKWRGKREA